jgi:hypothetical protein
MLLPTLVVLTAVYLLLFLLGQHEAVFWYNNVRNGTDKGSTYLLFFHYGLLFILAGTWIAFLVRKRATALVVAALPLLITVPAIVGLMLREPI